MKVCSTSVQKPMLLSFIITMNMTSHLYCYISSWNLHKQVKRCNISKYPVVTQQVRHAARPPGPPLSNYMTSSMLLGWIQPVHPTYCTSDGHSTPALRHKQHKCTTSRNADQSCQTLLYAKCNQTFQCFKGGYNNNMDCQQNIFKLTTNSTKQVYLHQHSTKLELSIRRTCKYIKWTSKSSQKQQHFSTKYKGKFSNLDLI